MACHLTTFLMFLCSVSTLMCAQFNLSENRCDAEEKQRIEELEKEFAAAQRQLHDVVEELRKEEESAHSWATLMIEELKAESLEMITRDVELDNNPAPEPASNPSIQTCQNEEHLRLVNGSSKLEGVLEVKEGHLWMTVCEDRWNQNGAQIVCAMLGYTGKDVAAVGSKVFGTTGLQVLPASGSCTAPAGVICGGLRNYRVRLVGGAGPYEGSVELDVNGNVGYICDDDWDPHDAMVICRMLGFTGDRVLATHNGFFGNGTGPSWGYNSGCSGNEEHIMSCSSTGSYLIGYRSTCSPTEAAGVVCANLNRYQVRLVNGTSPYQGRVEVRVNDRWLLVYGDYYWDNNDAAVVCRQLGYSPLGATAVQRTTFGSGTGIAELGYINCKGDEMHLMECPMSYGFNQNRWTDPLSIAGVICRP